MPPLKVSFNSLDDHRAVEGLPVVDRFVPSGVLRNGVDSELEEMLAMVSSKLGLATTDSLAFYDRDSGECIPIRRLVPPGQRSRQEGVRFVLQQRLQLQ